LKYTLVVLNGCRIHAIIDIVRIVIIGWKSRSNVRLMEPLRVGRLRIDNALTGE